MSRFLLIDIGAGTMDLLYYDSQTGQPYKAVVRSPVQTVAERAAALKGDLLVTGGEMGGGPITDVLRQKARENRIVMSRSAAKTLHHNPARIEDWGIQVVSNDESEQLKNETGFNRLVLGDLEPERLEQIVRSFGVPFSFDVVGVCAQDHGVPPEGTSHLEYRHRIMQAALSRNPYPEALLHPGKRVPETLNRLGTIAADAKKLPAREVFVMDSGMAAVLGASMDDGAHEKKALMVLDIATSHTVCATLSEGGIAGLVEYHTRDITPERLEALLRALAAGRISHEQVLSEGGHGAYLRKALGLSAIDLIIATGPKRNLAIPLNLPIRFGAPWGDNMMTGTVGLLEAVRRYKQMAPMVYI